MLFLLTFVADLCWFGVTVIGFLVCKTAASPPEISCIAAGGGCGLGLCDAFCVVVPDAFFVTCDITFGSAFESEVYYRDTRLTFLAGSVGTID